MTTGEKLKNKLNLNKFTSVKIARNLNTPVPLYIIVVDSKGYRITNIRVKKYPGVFQTYTGDKIVANTYTPLMDIETFNVSSLHGRIFFRIDLAGSNLVQKNKYFEKVIENNNIKLLLYGKVKTLIKQLLEYTIKDFRDQAVSTLTKKHYKLRQTKGSQGVTLESLEWSEKEDFLLLGFFVIPTFQDTIQVVDFKGNFKEDNHYETEILFENVSSYLGTKEEFLNLSKGEQIIKIRKMIKNADIRIHSNSPAFYWQGHHENADEEGFAIYAFQGTPGTGEWQAKHEEKKLNISKHMLETLQAISFIPDEIAQMIREEK